MRKELVFVTPDGRLVSVWWYDSTKAARVAARCICDGLEMAGAECLGEI